MVFRKYIFNISLPLYFRHEIEVHPGLEIQDTHSSELMDSEGYYRCRSGCGLVYKTKATRNRSYITI
jgi:hypothetical protein